MPKPLGALAGALAASAALASAALAHQTSYDRGVAVTLHVSPGDEPVAGRPASINVTRVRVPAPYRFSFGTCGCRLRVVDSAGAVLLDRAAGRRTPFTFPRPVAYRITFSGTYARGASRRPFTTRFAIRAGQS